MASLSGLRAEHSHAAAFQHAAQRKDVANIIVDDENLLADEVFVRAVQPFEHPSFLFGKIGHDAMQEQRGLVQQPVRRFDTLDDDASRKRLEPRVLLDATAPCR